MAEDLPSLVGRNKDSFFQLHRANSAYVHAEDVMDDDMNVNLDQTFKAKSIKGRSQSSRRQRDSSSLKGPKPSSVLGGAGPSSVLGGVAIQPAASNVSFGGSNPFDSRLGFGGMELVRPVACTGQQMGSLHESRSRCR